jgi:hypothetical protein
MTHLRGLVLLLAAVGPLAAAGAAHAQRRDYEHFEPDGDLGQILTRKLLDKRLDKYRQQYGGKWKLPQLGPEVLNDPALQKKLQDFLKADPKAAKLDPEVLKQLEQMKQAPPPPKEEVPPKQPNEPPGGAPPPDQNPAQHAEAPAALQDLPEPGLQEKMAQWAQDLASRLEGTNLGERLRESVAWQRGMQSLQGFLGEGVAGNFSLPGGGLGGLGDRLRLPKDWDALLPDLSRLRLPSFKMPSLSRPDVKVNLPNLNLGAPRVTGGVGVAGGGLGAWQAVLWVALAFLLGVVLWRLGCRGGWRARDARPGGWRLGPWPVNPAAVATRAELVRAFEYLALLRLGRDARVWNHREIAAHLAPADSAQGRAADALAALYEHARYAPDEGPLAAPDLDVARRNLCLLAGVATA